MASSPASPTPALSETSTAFSGPVRSDEDFETLFLWYLLYIYEVLGGDPATLINQPSSTVMVSVADYYGKNGVPQTLTPEEISDFRLVIEETSTLMASQSPPPPSFTTFQLTLDSMYAAVGGNPDTLP